MISAAIEQLMNQILPLAHGRGFPLIEQIDCVPVEDGSVSFHAHFLEPKLNGGLPACANVPADKAAAMLFVLEISLAVAAALTRENG